MNNLPGKLSAPGWLRAGLALALLACAPAVPAQVPGVLVIKSATGATEQPATNLVMIPRGANEAVLFQNGDVLIGSLVEIRPGQVVWRHPDAPTPIALAAGHLGEIQIAAAPYPPAESTNACLLRLTNDDELEGELVLLDAEKAVLKTWFAGQLTIPRAMVQSILPTGPSRSTIFEGPEGIEGWTLGHVNAAVPGLPDSGNWKYRNAAFYASKSASIARDVHLPEVASIQFDLAWKGFFHLAVALYTDYLHPVNLANKETEPDFGGFYSLQLNTFSANLLPVKKFDPIRYLGQVSLQSLNQKSSAQIDIRVNKPRKTIALLIDGNLVKQWNDADEFAGKGTALRFVHQGQGTVKISGIKVTEWDGMFEDKNAAPAPSRNDLARLRNGDRVSGDIDSINHGIIVVTLSDRKLDIPLTRSKQIDLATTEAVRPPAVSGQVQAWFTHGGKLTLLIERWNAETLLASSPVFGKATFHPRAFSRIEFPAAATPSNQ